MSLIINEMAMSLMTPKEEYVTLRNSLIPHAEKFANAIAGPEPLDEIPRVEWCKLWNQTFHETMNLLAKDTGLVS